MTDKEKLEVKEIIQESLKEIYFIVFSHALISANQEPHSALADAASLANEAIKDEKISELVLCHAD